MDTTMIQVQFLTTLTESKSPVAIYLRHGIKLKGNLVGFDDKALFLKDANGIQMVLIDAVSTVTPGSVY